MSLLFKRHALLCYLNNHEMQREFLTTFQKIIIFQKDECFWVNLQSVTFDFWQYISEHKIKIVPFNENLPYAKEAMAFFIQDRKVVKSPNSEIKKVKISNDDIGFVNSFFKIDILALRRQRTNNFIQISCPFSDLHKSNDQHQSASLNIQTLNVKCFAHTSKYKYYNFKFWKSHVVNNK